MTAVIKETSPTSHYSIKGIPLACPHCADHPHLDNANGYLHCPTCDRTYPFQDNRPCFLGESLAGEWSNAFKKAESRSSRAKLLEKIYRIVKAPRVTSKRRYNHFELINSLAASGKNYKTLYIGYSQPFAPEMKEHVIQLEVVPKEHVDVVGFGESLPFPAESFDLVVLSGVIEHTVQPFHVVNEAFRVLKGGGTFYISTPWVYPFHGGDNYRFSQEGLVHLCKSFSQVEIGSLDGPFLTLGIFLHYFICEGLSFGNRTLYYSISVLTSWLVFPLILLDSLLNKRIKKTYALDANIYAIAKK